MISKESKTKLILSLTTKQSKTSSAENGLIDEQQTTYHFQLDPLRVMVSDAQGNMSEQERPRIGGLRITILFELLWKSIQPSDHILTHEEYLALSGEVSESQKAKLIHDLKKWLSVKNLPSDIESVTGTGGYYWNGPLPNKHYPPSGHEPRDTPAKSENSTDPSETSKNNTSTPKFKKRKWFFAFGALAVLALIVYLPQFFLERKFKGTTIAILPFRMLSANGEEDWVQFGLLDMIIQGLPQSQGVSIVPTKEIKEIFPSNYINGQLLDDATFFNALKKGFSVDYFVGDFVITKKSGVIKCKFSIFDESYQLIHSQEVVESNLFQLGNEIKDSIAEYFQLAPLKSLNAMYSKSNLANENYARGIDKIMQGLPKPAVSYFEVCFDLDPEFYWAKIQLARCKRLLGDYDTATQFATEGLEESTARYDYIAQISALVLVSQIKRDNAAPSKALPYLHEALSLNREKVKGLPQEALILHNLGIIHYYLGNREKSLECYEDAREIHKKLGYLKLELLQINNLGVVYYGMGNLEKAREYYTISLEASRSLGNALNQADGLINLGTVEKRIRDFQKAKSYYLEALSISRANFLKSAEASALGQLGIIENEMGDYEAAEKLILNALEINKEVNVFEMSVNYHNLALSAKGKENYDKALMYLTEQLKHSISNDDPEGVAYSSYEIASLYVSFNCGSLESGMMYFQNAHKWFSDKNDAEFTELSGEYALGFQQIEVALEYFLDGLGYYFEINDIEALGKICTQVSILFLLQHQASPAHGFIENAYLLKKDKAQHLLNMALYEYESHNYDKALRFQNEAKKVLPNWPQYEETIRGIFEKAHSQNQYLPLGSFALEKVLPGQSIDEPTGEILKK